MSSSQLTYIGHATTLIELDGIRLLTDPILRKRVGHLNHRHMPLDPTLYQNVDAVIISHLHFDHLDLPSIKLLPADTPLIVPQGAGKLLRKFKNVAEISLDDTFSIGQVTLQATYAHHPRERYPFGPTADCLGFIIQGDYCIYFAGDTDIFPEMIDLVDELDVALLPVWGWGPRLGPGHMTPHRAAEALKLLTPRLAIPIHWGSLHPWGMGWFNPGFLNDPPHIFVRQAAKLAPAVKTHILYPGQTVALEHLLSES